MGKQQLRLIPNTCDCGKPFGSTSALVWHQTNGRCSKRVQPRSNVIQLHKSQRRKRRGLFGFGKKR
jgi:hypothetical protein